MWRDIIIFVFFIIIYVIFYFVIFIFKESARKFKIDGSGSDRACHFSH